MVQIASSGNSLVCMQFREINIERPCGNSPQLVWGNSVQIFSPRKKTRRCKIVGVSAELVTVLGF